MIRWLQDIMPIVIGILLYFVFAGLAGICFYYAFSPNAKSSCQCEHVKYSENNEVVK